MAISTTLPGLMATDKIKELAWTGRIVQGEEACALGLVTAVHENPSQVARDTAQIIASKSPDAIRAIKTLFDKAEELTTEKSLRLEARLQSSLLGRPNQVEAVTANLEKRSPEFEDPQS
jgi:enoyl-CoA hydratase/carnithine racemase